MQQGREKTGPNYTEQNSRATYWHSDCCTFELDIDYKWKEYLPHQFGR